METGHWRESQFTIGPPLGDGENPVINENIAGASPRDSIFGEDIIDRARPSAAAAGSNRNPGIRVYRRPRATGLGGDFDGAGANAVTVETVGGRERESADRRLLDDDKTLVADENAAAPLLEERIGQHAIIKLAAARKLLHARKRNPVIGSRRRPETFRPRRHIHLVGAATIAMTASEGGDCSGAGHDIQGNGRRNRSVTRRVRDAGADEPAAERGEGSDESQFAGRQRIKGSVAVEIPFHLE